MDSATTPPTPPIASAIPPVAGSPPFNAANEIAAAAAADGLQVELFDPRERFWTAGTLTYTRGRLVSLFFWLLSGDFFWQFRERAIGPAIPLLLRKFGANDLVASTLIGFIPPGLTVLLSPVISFRSDRLRTRWGRRIPFLLLSTPPAFLAMVGLALSPFIGGRIHHALGSASPGSAVCVVGTFAVFWVVFDVAVIVTGAVHGALVNDVVPREVIGTFFGLFRMASLGAGMLFFYFLLGKVETHYVAIFLSIGTAYAVCFTVMCLKVKEGTYPPPEPPAEGGPFRRLIAAIASYCYDCFSRPYYLWFFLSYFLTFVGFAPVNLFSVYFAQSVGMSMTTYGKYSTIQLALSLVQAPLLGLIADKVHPLRLTLFALAMYSALTGAAYLLVHDWWTFALSHVICGTVSGIWLTGSAPLAPALLPKLKFATFASVLVIADAAAKMVTSLIVGAIMEHLNHGKPPEMRDYHLMYLWASVFVGLSFVVMLVVHRYFMKYGGPRGYVAPEPAERPAVARGFAVVGDDPSRGER